MLLFSTILEIDKKLTKDDFINLVIESKVRTFLCNPAPRR